MNAANRMRTLVNDLLMFSQVTTRVARFVRTDLGQIAQEVVADLETVIAEAGGRVEIGELPVLEADALEMRQLFQNLIGNAIKYRQVDVPPVVTLSATNLRGPVCTIEVKDNGIGFKQEYAEKIFKMFARLHNKLQYGGSGIGLAICRRIVERHGGTIAAQSVAKEGTVFRVDLPLRHSKTNTSGLHT
jgi:light-regulated signal transduction histidine kinase (bacteriophytochrome)